MSNKIASIADHQSGMSHLIEAANPKTQPQIRREFPEDKCLKIRVIIDGSDYFVPEGNAGFENAPPFAFFMPLAYSAVKDPKGAHLGIQRHDEMRLIGTGIRTEVAALPSWWSERDLG